MSSLQLCKPLPVQIAERRLTRGPSTYWMAGLAKEPANFFKFLFIIVLYTLAMTLWVSLLYLHPVIVAHGPSWVAEFLVGNRI